MNNPPDIYDLSLSPQDSATFKMAQGNERIKAEIDVLGAGLALVDRDNNARRGLFYARQRSRERLESQEDERMTRCLSDFLRNFDEVNNLGAYLIGISSEKNPEEDEGYRNQTQDLISGVFHDTHEGFLAFFYSSPKRSLEEVWVIDSQATSGRFKREGFIGSKMAVLGPKGLTVQLRHGTGTIMTLPDYPTGVRQYEFENLGKENK